MSKNSAKSLPEQKQPPKHIELFFDRRDGRYWFKIAGRYTALKKGDLKLHFQAMGLQSGSMGEWYDGMPEIDWPFYNAQINYQVDYAGPLAGHQVGLLKHGGRQFLVTDQALGVWDDMPKKCPAPAFFLDFVRELLPGDQSARFCHWLSFSLRSLRNKSFSPGQILVLAGPPRCGKSFLQNMITEVLGGRSADPFKFLTGDKFSYQLAGAEHWMMEDPASTTDTRSRRLFGDMLKKCAFTRDFDIEQKGKDSLLLPISRRLTASINDEPENIARIPPLDGSIEDKIFIFRCDNVVKTLEQFRVTKGTQSLPLPGVAPLAAGEYDRNAAWNMFTSEVPAIRAYLLAGFSNVPESERDDRCGIRAWQHPDIAEILNSMAPENALLSLIDSIMFKDAQGRVDFEEGKSLDLEKQLLSAAGDFTGKVSKLLYFSTAMGVYLERIHRKQPERVALQKTLPSRVKIWRIYPPEKMKEHNEQEAL